MSTRRIRNLNQLQHVAPSREDAIEMGALYYHDKAQPCTECGGTIKRLVNGKCACLPLPSRPAYGRQ